MSIQSNDSIFALVATTGYLLLVDIAKRTVVPIENDRPEYYGISWQPNGDELILSHSALDNEKLIDLAAYAASEEGYISKGNVKSANILSAPHQILCASDGRLVCANTGRNAITVLDMDKPGHYQEQRLSAARWDRLSLENITGDHLNSVFEREGLLYVVAHGHHKGAMLATLDYPTMQIVDIETISNRTGLHNIWVTDEGQKISCHSNIGALIDLKSNQVVWSSGSPIYTRGLAASSDYLVVGESQMTGRSLRGSSTSGLWIVDRKTLRTLDYLCLGPYGAVNEVRLLNVPDFAHHGHVFNGLNELLQRDMFARHTEARLAASMLAAHETAAWADFDNVLGVPISSVAGKRTAAADSLCIITKNAGPIGKASSLDFHYSLDINNAASHVSVITYLGNGGDSSMHALLISPVNDKEAAIGLWNNDGISWSTDAHVYVGGLPLAGHIQARKDDKSIEVSINGRSILKLASNTLPQLNGVLGVRWLGASISPAKQ